MPTPETSRAALRAIYKTLPARRREVLDELFIRPGQTARELDARLKNTSAHKRASELRAAGLAFTAGTKRDPVTGHRAVRWYPCTDVASKPPPKKPGRAELLARLRELYGDLTTSISDDDPGAIISLGPFDQLICAAAPRPGGIILVAGDKLAQHLEGISGLLDRESANSPTGGF